MITQFRLDHGCRCGQTHQVPLDEHGEALVFCPTISLPQKVAMDLAQFRTLSARHGIERTEAIDTFQVTVHKVGPMRTSADQAWPRTGPPELLGQRCEDCGIVLCRVTSRRWWPDGTLVGSCPDGLQYRVTLPLSPYRERRCFTSRPI